MTAIQQLKALPVVLLLAALTLFSVSCTKVIDIDLNSGDPKIVVEGFVTEGETVHTVTITRTLNFDEDQAFPTIDNAIVTITDDQGTTQILTPMGQGKYETAAYLGVSGRTYTITATVDGATFTASSTIPQIVEIDSLYVQTFMFGPTVINTLVPARYDQAGVANYYQFNIYDNGVRVEGINLMDDQFTDGNYDVQPLFGGELETGDTAVVEMFGIDKPVYKYFYALAQNTQGATPANPTSNFTGGCLGYFSARTRDVKSVIVP